ncbi:MAG: hypothetical protein AAFS10_04110, partial [Myxococcota bacterium]
MVALLTVVPVLEGCSGDGSSSGTADTDGGNGALVTDADLGDAAIATGGRDSAMTGAGPGDTAIEPDTLTETGCTSADQC